MASKALGKITHYYNGLGVAVVKLGKGAGLKEGDKIQIKGSTTDFAQTVGSLQVNHKEVEAVKAGDDFGIKVDKKVREGDGVFVAK